MARVKKELDRFAENAKKDIPILVKLMSAIVTAIILSVTGVAVLSLTFFAEGVRKSTENDLMNFSHGLVMTLKDWRDTLEADVMLLSNRPDVVSLVAAKDSHNLNTIVGWANGTLNVELLAFTDESGNVLAAQGARTGENLKAVSSVASALRGIAGYSYDDIGSVGYSVIASAPVRSKGKVAGTVIAAYSLVNGDITDQVKDSYDAVCTIFNGNIRVATTLGENLIRTTLDQQEITNEVLNKGNEYHGTNTINGSRYMSVYFPLESSNGVISGMAFIARSVEIVDSIRNETMRYVIIGAFFFVIVFGFFCYRFINWLMIRIANVTNFLKELETGDADLTKRCKLFLRDEIGDLIIHFDLFLDKLQEIMSEIKGTKSELGESGSKLSLSTQDTSSAITEILANIESIHNQITSQTNTVTKAAGAVKEVSNNITNLDVLVNDQSAGVTQASTAISEMIENISSVTQSVDKMADSFDNLNKNINVGFSKQQDVNDRIQQIEVQSQMLEEANQAISSIAEQTNLLAMNAAIEAAHAGEAGKGFSVVADEIRKLSETSSSQSRSIGEQLSNIQASIKDVASSSSEASQAFSYASQHIKETDELVTHIKSAMEEQNEGSKQISNALTNMNESAQKVQGASKEMNMRNQIIMQEMQSLQTSTENMQSGMDEMAAGARKINSTGVSLSGISTDVQSAISKIGSQIDLFKTE
ncbi:MAG: methyl-accepting chemotaxis protein [Treponema sp.]|nr:methyl-accepting chemotaxis protein [Treponema sp.]